MGGANVFQKEKEMETEKEMEEETRSLIKWRRHEIPRSKESLLSLPE
jgi:hypothetical protein